MAGLPDTWECEAKLYFSGYGVRTLQMAWRRVGSYFRELPSKPIASEKSGRLDNLIGRRFSITD